MIPPKPFKYKCNECGYSKLVKPKSDAIDPRDFIKTCPKCKNEMDKVALNALDKILIFI